MNRPLRRSLFTLFVLLILLTGSVSPSFAAPGEPGSAEFGVGARLDLNSPGLHSSLTALKSLHLNWISIEYSWEKFSPKTDSIPNYDALDEAVEAAQSSGTAVMLSLTHPPAWALTPTGPDSSAVIRLLSSLLIRYPAHLQAIELFPAANTRTGWGAPADPEAYLRLYRTVASRLSVYTPMPFLIAGGVDVLTAPVPQGDISDFEFLEKLFQAAKDAPPTIVGLRYPSVLGNPSTPDDGRFPTVLRHYEEIRKLSRNSRRPATLLWITYLGLPTLSDRAAQSAWLTEAYPQIRSQLYIGAAFLQGLNTCLPGSSCAELSLLEKDGSLLPIASLLGSLSQENISINDGQLRHTKTSVLFQPR